MFSVQVFDFHHRPNAMVKQMRSLQMIQTDVTLQEHKEIIAEAMEVMEVAAGEQLYAQGDTGSRFYVIKEGSVTCTKTADPSRPAAVTTLTAGQFFGERALLKDEIRQATASQALCLQKHAHDWSFLIQQQSASPLLLASSSRKGHCSRMKPGKIAAHKAEKNANLKTRRLLHSKEWHDLHQSPQTQQRLSLCMCLCLL